MPGRLNLATAAPIPRRPSRNHSCPVVGALGGALAGFAATGNPLGACIGRSGFMGPRIITRVTAKGDEL